MLVIQEEKSHPIVSVKNASNRNKMIQYDEPFNFGFLIPENLTDAKIIFSMVIPGLRFYYLLEHPLSHYNTEKQEKLIVILYKSIDVSSKEEMLKLLEEATIISESGESVFMGLKDWLEEES